MLNVRAWAVYIKNCRGSTGEYPTDTGGSTLLLNVSTLRVHWAIGTPSQTLKYLGHKTLPQSAFLGRRRCLDLFRWILLNKDDGLFSLAANLISLTKTGLNTPGIVKCSNVVLKIRCT
jgi:hypothetical protein